MTTWILLDIAAFLMVVLLTGVMIPRILQIAFRKQIFDEVNSRKAHQGRIPRLGGIAFVPAIIFAMFLTIGCALQYGTETVVSVLQTGTGSLCIICSAVIIIYLIGIADDLVGLKYREKFVAQLIAAALVIIAPLTLRTLHGFLWLDTLPPVVSILLTALLTVFITNAINLIDGIDGLASGLSGIACVFYAYALFRAGAVVYSLLAVCTFGALVPFFYFNVFGDPGRHRKIFMGDTGSLTVGLILSVLSIRVCRIEGTVMDMNPGVVAFAPLLIPCFDVVRVFMHRIRNRCNPFMPDKNHIHHKLLALGMNQHQALLTIVGGSLALTLFSYLLSLKVNITLILAIDLVAWIAGNLMLTRLIRRRERITGTTLYK